MSPLLSSSLSFLEGQKSDFQGHFFLHLQGMGVGVGKPRPGSRDAPKAQESRQVGRVQLERRVWGFPSGRDSLSGTVPVQIAPKKELCYYALQNIHEPSERHVKITSSEALESKRSSSAEE